MIQYIGFETLGLSAADGERARVQVHYAAERLVFDRAYVLRVHVMNEDYEDGRAQYSAYIVLVYDSTTVTSDKYHAWDVEEALADAFESLQTALNKQLPRANPGIGKSGSFHAEAI